MDASANTKPGLEPRTILFVDDHEELTRTVCKLLLEAGFHVLAAPNGEEALRVLTIHPDVVDLLITDVMMPTMGGWDLARRARELRPNIKVLFITGSLAEEAAVIPEPMVQKPFRMSALLGKVQQVLAND
jgi:CheY-like chemotaxis protein